MCALVAEDKLTEAAYVSPAGPIAPMDMLYGHRTAMRAGNLFMAHRCGFTLNVLLATLESAGFAKKIGLRRPHSFELWAMATKSEMSDELIRNEAVKYFK